MNLLNHLHSIVDRVSQRFSANPRREDFRKESGRTLFERRPLDLEFLEPRILFSGAPAAAPPAPPVPDTTPVAHEAPTSEVTPPAHSVELAADTLNTTASPNPLVDTFIPPEVDMAAVDAIPEEDQGVTAITLTSDEVSALAEAAVQRWSESSLTSEQSNALANITYRISDLDGTGLGSAEGNLISIDFNANGRGWFVDHTPLADEEFSAGAFALEATDPNGTASQGIDLLSVILHEQGHVLGLDESVDSSSVMFHLFDDGERRLPASGQADGAVPGSLEGIRFVSNDLISVDSPTVTTDENTSIDLGINVDPDILLGGTLEDIIGVEAGHRESNAGSSPTSFTIPANATAVVITGYSNRDTGTGAEDAFNDDYQLLSVRIDLGDLTSSGTISHITDLSANAGAGRIADQFSWTDAELGTAILDGSGTVDGTADAGINPIFSVSGNELHIVETHGLQTAYHVEYLTAEGSSTNFKGTLSDVQQPNDTSSTFEIPDDTNYIVLTENSAAPGDNFRQEYKNYSRIIIDLDTLTASGVVMAEIGETGDRTVAYGFTGYDISAPTAGGVLVAISAATTGDTEGLAEVKHSPEIYVDGSGNLIVNRTSDFAGADFTTMYTAEAYERVPYSSISTSVGSGSDSAYFDATLGTGKLNTLSFEVPTSAKVGIFRMTFATPGGDAVNENMASGFAVIDLDTATSNGAFVNIRATTPDLVSWQGVSLTDDTLTAQDERIFFDHPNTVSNRTSLSQFTDGWGGTGYFDLTEDANGIRTITYNAISDVGDETWRDYQVHGQFEWLGKEAIRMEVDTTSGTFSHGAPILDSFGNPTGEWEIDIAELSLLEFIPIPGSSGDNEVTITLLTTSERETVTVYVNPIANTPDLTLNNVTTSEDNDADLSGSLGVALTDIDGSEAISLIEVNSIPDGFTLTDGTNSFTAGSGTNAIDVTLWNLDTLSLAPTNNYFGTVSLGVRSQTTDSAVVGGSLVTDVTEPTDTAPGETQATGSFQVTFTPANDDPETQGFIGTQSNEDADSGISLDVSAAFDDVDGDTLTYDDGGTLPGGLSINSSGFIVGTIDKDASISGPYTVTITADDGNGGTPAQQTFTWNVANPLPVALDDSFTAGEDGPSGVVGNAITNNDSDPDGDLLAATPASGAGTGGGTFSIAASGEVTFDPGTGFQDLAGTETATTTFVYTLNDADGATDTATITVTVAGANDDPDPVGSILDRSNDDSDGPISLDVSGFFTDPDASDTLTYDDGGTLPDGLSINSSGVIVGTIDKSASQSGPFNVTITVSDGNGGSTTQSFQWAVNNPPPDAIDDAFTAGEDDPSGVVGNAITNNDSDPDGDLLTATPLSGVAGGTFAIAANGAVSFDPDGDFESLATGESATTTFVYTLNDADGATDTATITVTVAGANDDPVATGTIADQSGTDSQPGVSLDVSGNFDDDDTSDTLTFDDGGTLPTGLSIDPATGIITGTIDSGASQGGPYTVTITADDGNGGTPAQQTFTWNVANPLPVALDDSFTAGEDGPSGVVGNAITNNDSDPDGDLLTATPLSGVAGSGGGTFAIAANGEVTFDPGTGFQDLAGTESATTAFVYTLNDADGDTDTATVTVTVTGANDAPVIDFDANDNGGTGGADFAQTFTEGGTPVTIADADASVADVDDTSMTAFSLTVSGVADGDEEVVTIAGTDFNLGTTVSVPRTVSVGSTTFAITYDNASGTFSFGNQAGGEMLNSDLQALIAATTYRNDSPFPTEGNRIVTALVNDGDDPSNTATSTISVTRDPGAADWLLTGSTSVIEGAGAVYTISQSAELRDRETASVRIDLADIDTNAADHATWNTAMTAAVASYNFGTNPGYLEWDGSTLKFTSDDTGIMTPFNVVLGTTDNSIYEGDEDFRLTLSNPGSTTGETIGISTLPVTTTITDAADIPTLSIDDVSAKEGVDTHAVFTLSLSNASVESIGLSLSLADGDATIGTDTGSALEYFDGTSWLPVSGNVTIPAGQTTLQVRTAVANDSLIESDETFILTASPVSGTLTSTADITGTGTIFDNDARLTEFLPPGSGVTTDVELQDDGTGRLDLVIEDVLTESTEGFSSKVDSADSFDRISVIRVGDNFVISDLGGLTLGSPIIGASRTGASEIIVPVSMVTGDIIIRTGISDDVINVGNLGSLAGELVIDGHMQGDPHTNDFDIINYSSDFSGSGAKFEAEAINVLSGTSLNTDTIAGVDFDARRNIVVEEGALISATGGGNVNLDAHTDGILGGTPSFEGESFNAIEITAATIGTTGGGAVTANGVSGSSGSYNHGILVNPFSDITTDGGGVTLTGTAGGSTGSVGFRMRSSSVESNGGDVFLAGQGGDTGTYDRGVAIDVELAAATRSVVAAGTGSVTIIGTGGGTGLYGTGILVSGTDVSGIGVTISGTGGNNGTMFNEGVSIQKSSTVDAGTGDIDIDGTGGAGGTMNRGVSIGATTLTSDGGNLAVDGTGGGTSVGMYGIGVQFTAVSATTNASGTISLRGTGADGTLYNEGVRIASKSQIDSADGGVSVEGTGGGKIRGSGVTVSAQSTVETSGTGTVTLTGTGSATGSSARGIDVSSSEVRTSGGKLTLTGTGGQTGSSNLGVAVANSEVENIGGGDIDIDGTGGGNGMFSIGIDLVGSDLDATGLGSINLDGTGALGTTGNVGVKIATSSTVQTEDGEITVVGITRGTGLLNHGIQITANSALGATGFGSIGITGSATSGSTLNYGIDLVTSSVTVNDGDLILTGVSGGLVSLNKGIDLKSSTLKSTGDGDISVEGSGSDSAIGALNFGVDLTYGKVAAEGSGSISIIGTGGTGSVINKGVKIANRSAVTTSGGNISISGTGGGSGALSGGVSVETSSSISTGGWGDLTITGQGSSTGSLLNDGVLIATNSQVSSANGTLTMLGTGGGGNLFNSGIKISGAKVISTGGDIRMIGSGGLGTSFNQGIRITSSTVDGAGDISMHGSASEFTTGQNNCGVYILNTMINCGGEDDIQGTGGGGTGNNHGVFMNGIQGDFSGTSNDDDGGLGVFFGILPAAIMGTKKGQTRKNPFDRIKGGIAPDRHADATTHTLQSLFERLYKFGAAAHQELGVTQILRHQDNLITLDPVSARSEDIDTTLAAASFKCAKAKENTFRTIIVSGNDDEPLSGLVVLTDAEGILIRFSSLRPTKELHSLSVGEFIHSIRHPDGSQAAATEAPKQLGAIRLDSTATAIRRSFGIN